MNNHLLIRNTIFLLFLLSSVQAKAQLCHGGKPVGKFISANSPYTIKFPGLSDNEVKQLKQQSNLCLKSLTFAKTINTEINPAWIGNWEKHPSGMSIWQIKLVSPKAHSINLTFGKYRLKKGAKLFVYDPAQKYVLGALTNKNNNPDGILSVSPVPGDEIIIELQVPYEGFDYGELKLSSFGHDFLDVFTYIQKDGQYGRSGNCNLDVNCVDNASIQLLKRSVCRIIYNNNELCTGTLINNTTHDATPYLITANHCLPDQAAASTAVFLFGYESPACDGPDGNSTWAISGSELLATTHSIDFSLVKLSKEIPTYFFPYFTGWDHSDKNITSTFSIHHPWGDVKKISFDDDPPMSSRYTTDYQPESHWKILEWDSGTTEPGSSGSPLFNSGYLYIGDLTGGEATCSNPLNDYYTKFSMAWDFFSSTNQQLEHWLDPIGTGLQYINGFFPSAELISTCERQRNFESGNELEVNRLKDGWGYWTGHSSLGFTSFAEKINNDTILKVPGLHLLPAKVPTHSSGKITIKIWSGDALPGLLLAEKKFSFSQLAIDTDVYLPFDTIVTIEGSFYVGYEIDYSSETDTFALYQVNSSIKPATESFYLKDEYGWQSYNNSSLDTEFGTLAIHPFVCGNVTRKKPLVSETATPTFFPNPVVNKLTIDFKNTYVKNVQLSVFDLSGRLVLNSRAVVYSRNWYVDFDKLQQGIYVCRIVVNNEKFSKKIMVARN